jgi:hypothetical protein
MPTLYPSSEFGERALVRDFSLFCRMDGTDVPIASRLSYDPAYDPHSITLILERDSAEPMPWRISRDLLAAGLVSEQVGDDWIGRGLIAVRRAHDTQHPEEDLFWIRLDSGDEYAYLWVPLVGVSRFLGASFALVALGDEQQHVPDSPAVLSG